ncbi:glycoside hydrolase superfamily [Mycena galericulata]|nr:glycoside hydrolase superfamily [Mycena galericulata]
MVRQHIPPSKNIRAREINEQIDTPNLTAFFQELRAALGSSVLISCATPAGYWFLKGFEIDKITSSVDYLNMMSYDYHGPWDTNVTDQAPVTNPHTSIQDMTASVLLYMRAGIDMSIVNLGSSSQKMVGGGTEGPCSQASGYLTQFEITDILASGITPTLDSTSETYWFDNAVRLYPCSLF